MGKCGFDLKEKTRAGDCPKQNLSGFFGTNQSRKMFIDYEKFPHAMVCPRRFRQCFSVSLLLKWLIRVSARKGKFAKSDALFELIHT